MTISSSRISEAGASSQGWWQPFQSVAVVDVFHVDLTPHPSYELEALRLLDDEERERLEGFRYPRHRRQFVLCRAAVRSILCDRLGCENEELAFRTVEHGKPLAVLKGKPAPVSFNTSHSGSHGLIALANGGRLGVDVEERCGERNLDAIIEDVFTGPEQVDLAAVSGSCKLHLFYKLWTTKEACIKALGTGLSLSPASFEVPYAMRHGGGSSVFEFPEMGTVQWQLTDLGNERFAAAVAHEMEAVQSSESMAG